MTKTVEEAGGEERLVSDDQFKRGRYSAAPPVAVVVPPGARMDFPPIVTPVACVFEVRGNPVPEGSTRAFVVGGHAVVTHDRRRPLNDWRHLVRDVAQRHAPPIPWDGPIGVCLQFRVRLPTTRPVFAGRGRERHPVRVWPDRRPDLDKLARGLLDALIGVYFTDDSQVVQLYVVKDYGVPGVTVNIWPVGVRP